MDVSEALTALREVSTQVETAVVIGPEGRPLGSTLSDDAASARVASAAMRLLAAADAARPDDAPEVTQLEAATQRGCVFVVREGERAVAATTGPEPTIGLVMYDLRNCLRSLDVEPAVQRRTKAERA